MRNSVGWSRGIGAEQPRHVRGFYADTDMATPRYYRSSCFHSDRSPFVLVPAHLLHLLRAISPLPASLASIVSTVPEKMAPAAQCRAGGLTAFWRKLTAWYRPQQAEPTTVAATATSAAISRRHRRSRPKRSFSGMPVKPAMTAVPSQKGEALWQHGELLKGFLVEDNELGRGGMGRTRLRSIDADIESLCGRRNIAVDS